jgi:hypothetical protein
MTTAWTIECEVHFQHGGHGRGKQVREGPKVQDGPRAGRVPRVSRLMALALRLDAMLDSREFSSQAEVARLGRVTRARVCQIMNLVNLAPDIQEAVLFLPHTRCGRDRIILADLQPIASLLDWRRQRLLWKQVTPCGQQMETR